MSETTHTNGTPTRLSDLPTPEEAAARISAAVEADQSHTETETAPPPPPLEDAIPIGGEFHKKFAKWVGPIGCWMVNVIYIPGCFVVYQRLRLIKYDEESCNEIATATVIAINDSPTLSKLVRKKRKACGWLMAVTDVIYRSEKLHAAEAKAKAEPATSPNAPPEGPPRVHTPNPPGTVVSNA